jgi:signal peptidase I
LSDEVDPPHAPGRRRRPSFRILARRRSHRAGRERKRRRAPWWELPALVALAIGIAVLVKTFVIQPFFIPSGSMRQTLNIGDRILVNKLIYDFRDPHPGDIVVFHAPPGWNDEPAVHPPSNPILRAVRGFGQLIGFVPPDGLILVKRVIAVGGQTVKGDGKGNVYVSNHGPNGPYRELREPFVWTPKIDGPQAPFGPMTVPAGRLWVMGDHRNDSADSRFHCRLGGVEDTAGDRHCNPYSSTVPTKDVIGKAFVIAWPPSHWRTLGTPATFTISAAAGSVLPSVAATGAVVPIFCRRRRRRRNSTEAPRVSKSEFVVRR